MNTFSFFNVEIFWEEFLVYIYIDLKFPQYSRDTEYCIMSLLWLGVFVKSVINYFVLKLVFFFVLGRFLK